MEKIVGIVVVLMLFPLAMTTAEGLKEAEDWFHSYTNTTSVPPQKVTQLQFYTHNLRGITTALVAQPNVTDGSPTSFGMLYAMDNPLTVGPSLQDSKLIGRSQGIFCSTSMGERSFTMAMALVFIDGPFNGSSLSILGHNPVLIPNREMPVIGGSGVFRLARGFALLNSYFIDIPAGNAVIKYDVTVYQD